MLTSFTLIDKNKTVIQDNGYNFDAAEEAKKKAEEDKREEDHKQRVAKIKKSIQASLQDNQLSPQTMDILGLKDLNRNPAVMKENNRFNKDILHRQMDSISKLRTLPPTKFGKQNQRDSNNFDEPTPLFGNGNLEFSYWLDPKIIPSKLKITTTKTIFGTRRAKSFVISKMANNQNENNDVHNQDDDLN